MLKLAMAGTAISLVLLKPAMLLQLAFFAGLFYLISYIRRHNIFGRGHLSDNAATGFTSSVQGKFAGHHNGQGDRIISTFGINSNQLTAVRSWLDERHWRERLAELIGSLLVAALACIVLNLIPFSIPPAALTAPGIADPEPLVDFWGRYAFAASVSVCACWIILTSGKLWEVSHGETWLRRGVMAALGIVIGIAGWTAADFFDISLSLQSSAPTNQHSNFQISGVPVIPAYLIFYAVLFGSLRWWHQVDPVRKSRLSLWTVGLCFVWAVIFSHVLGQSPIAHGLFAIVVSTSLQLAAPWMGDGERKKIVAAAHK